MNGVNRITPWLLRDLGMLESFRYSPREASGQAWQNHYRVLSVSMNRAGGNLNRQIGAISLSRDGVDADSFAMTVRRKVLMEEGNAFRGDTTITISQRCRTDAFGTPIEWELRSVYSHFDRSRSALHERRDTVFRERGFFRDGWLHRQAAPGDAPFGEPDQSWRFRECTGALSTNWGIFELLQQSSDLPGSVFDLWENGLHLKPGYTLHAVPDSKRLFDSETGALESIMLCGSGNLPYEFWRDEGGRIVAVINGSKICILDDDADAVIADHEANGVVYPTPNEDEA